MLKINWSIVAAVLFGVSLTALIGGWFAPGVIRPVLITAAIVAVLEGWTCNFIGWCKK